jgi:hypothetical protein
VKELIDSETKMSKSIFDINQKLAEGTSSEMTIPYKAEEDPAWNIEIPPGKHALIYLRQDTESLNESNCDMEPEEDWGAEADANPFPSWDPNLALLQLRQRLELEERRRVARARRRG